MNWTRLDRAGRSLLTLNRDREYRALSEMLSLQPGDRLLDVGSGDGFWTVRFGRHCGSVIGLEPGQEAVSWARKLHARPNVEYIRGTAEAIPFPDETFDKIVSVSCIEHFGDPEQGMREMTRVLKPGGRIALSADTLLAENSTEEFRNWHRRRHYVTRYFDESGLEQMMTASGLSPEPDSTIHLFHSRVASSLRRVFITRPAAWLPLFPFFYGGVRLADWWADDTHGQIIIATATR